MIFHRSVQNEEVVVLPYTKKHGMPLVLADMKVLRFDESSTVRSIVHKGKIFLSSRDICDALGYANISQALTKNCSSEYIVELQNIASNPMDIQQISMAEVEGETALQHSQRMREKWLEEPAVYELIGQSRKPEAKQFKKWLYEEVLPSLSKNGTYSTHTRNQQVQLFNETDLHYKIVEFIRSRYPGTLIIAGLGENQITSEMRLDSWRKGYTKGQPDIMIPIRSGRKVGLALELKSPGWQGEASENKKAFLDKLQAEGWQICVSNCYEDLLFVVRDYMEKGLKGKKRKRT